MTPRRHHRAPHNNPRSNPGQYEVVVPFPTPDEVFRQIDLYYSGEWRTLGTLIEEAPIIHAYMGMTMPQQRLRPTHPTDAEITAFHEYMHACLAATPPVLQPYVYCEWAFGPVTLQWSEAETVRRDFGGHLMHDLPEGLNVCITGRETLGAFERGPEEPAYIKNEDVLTIGANVVDDMLSDERTWTYPRIVTGKHTGKLSRGRTKSKLAGGKPAPSRIKGIWQYIGMNHPQWKTPEDRTTWLPKHWGGGSSSKRRVLPVRAPERVQLDEQMITMRDDGLWSEGSVEDGMDVRLQLILADGDRPATATLHFGLADYDNDHRGFWSDSVFFQHDNLSRIRTIVDDMYEQCLDQAEEAGEL